MWTKLLKAQQNLPLALVDKVRLNKKVNKRCHSYLALHLSYINLSSPLPSHSC